MPSKPPGGLHWTVLAGLLIVLLFQSGTPPPSEDAPCTDTGSGSGTEHPGYRSWEDRQPFMQVMDGPKGVPGFGLFGSNLGDVDGDGCDDFVSMDTWFGWFGGPTFRRAVLLPGRPDGDFSEDQYTNLSLDLTTYACGDVNGDALADVLSLHGTGRPREGDWDNVTFEIRFGRTSGLRDREDQYIIIVPFSKGAEGYRQRGWIVSPVGDINGDGYDDVIVFGLVEADSDFFAEFQVLHGSTDGLGTKAITKHAVPLDNPEDWVRWNWTQQLTHADVNGDGISDVIIRHGEPHYHVRVTRPDAYTIHFGSSEGFSPEPDQEIERTRVNEHSYAVSHLNLNGDKYDDLGILDVHKDEDGLRSHMRIEMYNGSSQGLRKAGSFSRPFESSQPWHEPHFGFSDLDGDGFDDLALLDNVVVNITTDHGCRRSYYDRYITLWRNEGGTVGEDPWWSTCVRNDTGDRVKINRGDYDGDGKGDLLITLSGWGYRATCFPVDPLDGKVLLLLGGRKDRIDDPVYLDGGPLLYANYSTYRFIVEERPLSGMTLVDVSCRIDPYGADEVVRLSRERDPTGSPRWGWYLEDADPSMDVTGVETFQDGRDGTSWIAISIMFGWDWPHEDPCDIELEYRYRADNARSMSVPVVAPDVFSVENDLDLVGTMVVEAEWQGTLEPGDWVRGGEHVEVGGLWVVYQGTVDVFPSPSTCQVVVFDNEEDHTIVPSPHGEEVRLTFEMDGGTDPYERLSVTLQDLPPGSHGPAPRTFSIKVDADPPKFRNPMPDGDEWVSADPVPVGITTDDTGTSGVDASTLEFSLRGILEYSGWTRSGVVTGPDGPLVDGMAGLRLPDGEGYYLRWRVRDLVGNLHVMPGELRLRVDTRNVTFTDVFPGDTEWHNVSRILAGVTITDVEGSGIDVSSIEHRVSHHNLSRYGDWKAYSGQHTDSQVIDARAYVDLGEGPFNYVQWRAADIAGNGLTASGHFLIQVDTLPVTFSDFQPTDVQNTTEVNVSIVVDDGQWGVGIDFERVQLRVRSGDHPYGSWMEANIVHIHIEKPPFGPQNITLVLTRCYATADLFDLVEGGENHVQFRAWDRLYNGPALSGGYRIAVDTRGPFFFNITPLPEEVMPHPEVAVSVCVDDAMSGVDVDSVQYRYGTEGEGSLGEWMRMPVMPVEGHHGGTVTIRLDRGRTNHIQFRALDTVGNLNESESRAVWVNNLPRAVIAFPPNGSVFSEGERITLSALGSSDPDGDPLDMRWTLTSSEGELAVAGNRTSPLGPGLYDLTLVVTDAHGARAEATVQLTVEEVEVGLFGGLMGLLMALLVVLVIALVVMYLRLRREEDALG